MGRAGSACSTQRGQCVWSGWDGRGGRGTAGLEWAGGWLLDSWGATESLTAQECDPALVCQAHSACRAERETQGLRKEQEPRAPHAEVQPSHAAREEQHLRPTSQRKSYQITEGKGEGRPITRSPHEETQATLYCQGDPPPAPRPLGCCGLPHSRPLRPPGHPPAPPAGPD